MSKEKEQDHELPEVTVHKFLCDHTDEQLKDVCIDELRRIIPKLFLFLCNHDYRMSKKVKGLWDKPPVWWDDKIPFLDPNNCRRTWNATEDGTRKKPTKGELLPMFFFLVQKCRCRLKESCGRQMEPSLGSNAMDSGNHGTVHSIDSTKSSMERLLDEIQNDVADLSISSTPEKNMYICATDSVRKMGITTTDDDSKISVIEYACKIKAAICIHKTVGDVPDGYKKFLTSLSGISRMSPQFLLDLRPVGPIWPAYALRCLHSEKSITLHMVYRKQLKQQQMSLQIATSRICMMNGAVPNDTGEDSSSDWNSASGRSSITATGFTSTVRVRNAVEMASVKQDYSQQSPSTILYNTNVEPEARLCYGESDFHSSVNIDSVSTSSYSCPRDVVNFVGCSLSNTLPLLSVEDVMETLPISSDCMDVDDPCEWLNDL